LDLLGQPDAKCKYGNARLENQTCETATITVGDRKHVFYLAPEYNHAVRRREDYDDQDRLLAVAECQDFHEVAGFDGLWLPRQTSVSYFQFFRKPEVPHGSVVFQNHYTLVSIEKKNTPVEGFKLNYDEPGTIVADDRLPSANDTQFGVINYEVPADPNELNEVIAKAITTASATPRRKRWILIGVNIVIIWGLGFAIWSARKHKRAA
jgi:hypothetical protein